MLGNPVSVVRGLADCAIDLFYEPYKVCITFCACIPALDYTHTHARTHAHACVHTCACSLHAYTLHTIAQSYKILLFLLTGGNTGWRWIPSRTWYRLEELPWRHSGCVVTHIVAHLSTCTLGGVAGAGAKVTGAVGDVFAKLTFDEEFIDRRQQQKAAPPRFGSKFTGFAKVIETWKTIHFCVVFPHQQNVFQGVTGVVTQPVKGCNCEITYYDFNVHLIPLRCDGGRCCRVS